METKTIAAGAVRAGDKVWDGDYFAADKWCEVVGVRRDRQWAVLTLRHCEVWKHHLEGIAARPEGGAA